MSLRARDLVAVAIGLILSPLPQARAALEPPRSGFAAHRAKIEAAFPELGARIKAHQGYRGRRSTKWVSFFRGIHGDHPYELGEGIHELVTEDLALARGSYARPHTMVGQGGLVLHFRMPRALTYIGAKRHPVLSTEHLKQLGVADVRPFLHQIGFLPADGNPSRLKWVPYDGVSREIWPNLPTPRMVRSAQREEHRAAAAYARRRAAAGGPTPYGKIPLSR
jgi:hypothetical protein